MIKLLKKMWHGEVDGLTAAALIIGASSLLSRLLGIVRDRVLASTFGAGDILDAYYAAFRLPDTIYNLVILGALSAGFIPVFSEYLERKGKPEAMKLASQVLATVGAVLAVASVLIAMFAPWIVPFIAPGFTAEKLAFTIELTRVMALSPFFLGLSGVLGGVLQSLRIYAAYALAPALYNIGIIIGTVAFVPWLGPIGLAWGVALGAFAHFFIQLMHVMQLGLPRLPMPSFKPEGVRRILKLMAPRTAGLGVTQVNAFVLLAIATTIESGAVAVFNLANNLQSFPIGLIGISFSIAAFPALARAFGASDETAFKRSLSDAARKILFFTIPATALFILLRAQIVRITLGDGNFDWNDTIRTADVLGWFAVSLTAQSLVPLYARAFYAIQNTWTPLWIGIVSEVTNFLFAITMSRIYGVSGLAMALSIAAFVQLVLLYALLRRQRGPLGGMGLMPSVWKVTAASIVMCVIAFPLRQWIGTLYPLRTFWQVLLQFGVSLLGGGAAFLLTAWLLKSPELNEFVASIKAKLWKKMKVSEGAEEASGMANMG
ncbi:MAG TPA: murein biosynthesis integral membrane protein MurJ [Verrucomicrobiae bacterium]|nr:murein biosynthesis integral membrane protein MurJ [Verrucomicrobiae bacterium]